MKYILIGGIVVLAVFLFVLAWIPLGIEPLTELYLDNHTELRAHIFPDTDYNFSFVVNNLEYQDMRYEYDVSIFDEEGNFMRKIDSGEILLGNNESQSVSQTYNLWRKFDRAQIKVLIKKDHLGIVPSYKKKLWWPDPNYPTEIDVHFWVEEVVGTTVTITPD